MLIDLTVAIVLLVAVFKGLRQGFILAIFSVVGLLIGLAAALKLSAMTANYLSGSLHVSARWLPVLSFALVFLAAVLLVRLVATAIQKTMELAMLGWLNRLGGILAYGIIYLLVLSVLFFYLDKMHLLSPSAEAESKTFSYIQPLGPKTMSAMAQVAPFLKDIFEQLTRFFEGVAKARAVPA